MAERPPPGRRDGLRPPPLVEAPPSASCRITTRLASHASRRGNVSPVLQTRLFRLVGIRQRRGVDDHLVAVPRLYGVVMSEPPDVRA